MKVRYWRSAVLTKSKNEGVFIIMIEKYTITLLTEHSVSVLRQKFTVEGEQIGKNWRRAYVNSEVDRQKINIELPSPQKEAILTVWGDAPTIMPEDTHDA